MSYDIRIDNATIVDGTGAPGYQGSVGISNGKIVALGDAPDDAATIIDGTGKIVSPGFIDIHTHYDAQIMWDRMLSVSPWHGVTTVLLGNCGFGIAPTRPKDRALIVGTLEKVEGMSRAALNAGLDAGGGDWNFESFPEYLDAIERQGIAVNVACYLGHSPLRVYVMGEEAMSREATDDEIDQMKTLLREAINAGAIGLATSESPNHIGYEGRPVPSRLAADSEMQRLAEVMGEIGRGIMQVSAGGEIRFDHYAALAEATGNNFNWSSLLTRKTHPDLHNEYLAKTNELIASGRPIYPQMSCRELTMEFDFGEPFPMERLELFEQFGGLDKEARKKIYAEPDFRAALAKEMSDSGSDAGPVVRLRGAWADTVVSDCATDRSLEERSLSDIAAERGVDPIDVALDLSLDSDFVTRFRIPLANNLTEGVRQLLQNPYTLLGLSDAGAHTSQLCDACFPTHLLGYWVRDQKAISMEEAIRKLTSLPADVFGLAGRGRLATGGPADVVLFDPATVSAGKLRRANDLPAGEQRLVVDSIGIDAVIVNGVMLRDASGDVLDAAGPLPGALLRGGAAQTGKSETRAA